jgi:5'-methylthioadenosine phosphorylase
VPEIGVIGGPGLYPLFDQASQVSLETPYGNPSDQISIGTVEGREVAFLPRHGRNHNLPPSAVNNRANVWAMKKLGVERLVATSSVRSLQPYVRPGDFMVCDQFIDRTRSRADTFIAEGPEVAHVDASEPYCPELRSLALQAGLDLGVEIHEQGTVVVIEGPRLPSRSEGRWFSAQGWDVVDMAQYPELILARELELCYTNLALVAGYDSGVADIEQVDVDRHHRFPELLGGLIALVPGERSCACGSAMVDAFVGDSP